MTSTQALFRQGVTAYKRKNFKKAADLFQQTIALDSTRPDYWIYLGLSLEHTNRYGDAEDIFTTAINLTPKDPHIYFYRGYSKYLQHKYQDAIEDFNQAQRLDETEFDQGLSRLYLYLGRSYEALGEYKRAITNYGLYGSYIGHPHLAD